MSVLRQANWLGQQRVDVPHLRAIESSISADFDLLAGAILAGLQAFVVNGFSVVMSPSPINSPATSILINTQSGSLLHPLATEAGTIFRSPAGRTTEQLTSTNSRVSGSFVASTVNYIGVDLRRAADSSTSDTAMFLDPTSLQEQGKVVPLARTLDYLLVVSTTDFSATPGICPIAKVTTDANNNVSAVVDCRRLMFRLGTGGSNPNTQNAYSWPQGRAENTSGDVFSGGDKAIGDFKAWMDAVMTRCWESNGGRYWYSSVTATNIKMQRVGSVLANGEYFSWNGTELSWTGLTFLIPNSPASYNDVRNSSSGVDAQGTITLAEGDCVYVDLDFETNRVRGVNALTVVKAAFASLGSPTTPGSRMILAWRLNNVIYTRDGNWPVGTLFQPASNSALGVVQLLTAANTANTPIVATVDTVTNMLVAGGVSRNGTAGSVASGPITIGGGANDASVTIGKAATNTTILGTAKLDTLDKNAANYITCNTGMVLTASLAGGTGLGATGNGVGIGLWGIGGNSSGTGVVGDGGAPNGKGGMFTGAGTGQGLDVTGGSTGNGITVKGGSTSGSAIVATANVSDFPIEQALDQAGNRRSLIDHNGYRMGQVFEYVQNWTGLEAISAPGASTINTEFSFAEADPGDANFQAPGANTLPCPSILVRHLGGGLGAVSYYSTPIFVVYNYSAVVVQFALAISASADADMKLYAGITNDANGNPESGSDSVYVSYVHGTNRWRWNVRATGQANSLDNDIGAVPPTVGGTPLTLDFFRFELHGSTSAQGVAAGTPLIKIYMNGSLIATRSYTLSNAQRFFIGLNNNGAGSGPHSLTCGPVRICYNLLLAPPAL